MIKSTPLIRSFFDTQTRASLMALRTELRQTLDAVETILDLLRTECVKPEPPGEPQPAELVKVGGTLKFRRRTEGAAAEPAEPQLEVRVPGGRLMTAVRLAIASIPEPFTVKSVALQLDQEFAEKVSSVSLCLSKLANDDQIIAQGKEGRAFLYCRGKSFTAPVVPTAATRDNYSRLTT